MFIFRLRTVKKAHIRTLDQQFVNAYETIGANKVAFESVVSEFRRTSVRGWGFLEFQYVAMEYMKAFNVDKDVNCYNQLLNMYPRGPLRIANYFSEAMHHGKLVRVVFSNNCAIPRPPKKTIKRREHTNFSQHNFEGCLIT